VKDTVSLVRISGVTLLAIASPPRWSGRLLLPGQPRPVDILIFATADGYTALAAACPHEGHSLAYCALHEDGALVCPAHGLRIELEAKGLPVYREGEDFFVPLAMVPRLSCRTLPEPADDGADQAITRLNHEISQLTQANFKKERQIIAITRSMEAMLEQAESQKLRLKEASAKQQAMMRFVNRVIDGMDDLLLVIGADGRITQANAAVQDQLGFREEELLGMPFDELLRVEERNKLAAQLPELPWRVQSVMLENIRLSNGYSAEHWDLGGRVEGIGAYQLKGNLLHSEQGKLEGAVITASNISQLKDKEMKLRLSAKVFENSGEAIFITDAQAHILDANAAFTDITGYDKAEVIGRNVRFLKSGRHDCDFYVRMWRELIATGRWRGEVWDRRKDGETFPILLTINALVDDGGGVSHYVAIFSDISHLKQTEQKLEQLAYYDALTALPNRFLFKDRLEHECALAQRSGIKLAVFFIDLDRFKYVNDTFGHWAGDRLLQEVAERIKTCVRISDTVARLGGDEFTVILSGISEAGDAADIAQKIIKKLEEPLDINNQQIYVSASIGIALAPDDGMDFTTLTKHADAAMYAAKAKGKSTFQYFEVHMNVEAQRRIELETKFRRALEMREFILCYQPKADSRLARITGAEALVRWQHPEDGMIAPDRFIPIAEETGLIYPLGKWILRTAFLQANHWAKRFPGFRVAVNLSARQLLADNFIDDLDCILQESGVSSSAIELEITESLVMHDIDTATKRLRAIAERGIRVAMDDFGTGYSSLSYLQKLPIDILKIDRSFIQEYRGPCDGERAALIKAIIAMGRSLNMQVVAEGVETRQQLELLNAYGCDEVQGYLLSPAMAAAQFEYFHGAFSNGGLAL
jgi:diguanylate cyclase (GGDEF)-like protein/PAS domain S-box-containing protein